MRLLRCLLIWAFGTPANMDAEGRTQRVTLREAWELSKP